MKSEVTEERPLEVIPASAVADLPKYSFNNTGTPLQTHHNWGAACSEGREIPGDPLGRDYDCFFLLGLDDSLDLGGHIIGLPDPLEYTDNTPIPELRYTWTLTAGATVETFVQGSPQAPLGETRPRNPEDPDGFEEFCFAQFFNYTDGICQLLDFNSGALTGSALLDLAAGGDIFLDLSVELLAPTGFEFVNITDYDSGAPDVNLGEVRPWEELDESGPFVLRASAERMPIRVDVPVPSTVLLFAAGAMLLMRRRRHTQHP
ncbi:MAG: hypothetical protein Cons2KO_10630 [Congregibacter sp.]